ncbi:MAG: hypothetical protein DMF24_10950 [Verrucomicrobia bacterium]|nr:MAG: hypothetical protein DMF24_10950 [Verrucomicrobiota bacterium]
MFTGLIEEPERRQHCREWLLSHIDFATRQSSHLRSSRGNNRAHELQKLRRSDRVNLERALTADGQLGGHFVQGHIDCVSRVVAFEKKGPDFRLEVELPAGFAQYVARKGSIALNGISLTVADVFPKSFAVWIIPYTRSHTNLNGARAGDLLNVEFDILAKYVERVLAVRGKK